MTGGLAHPAAPRPGGCGRIPDALAAVETTSGTRFTCSGMGSGVSGARFSAAC
jgi:hypothetical protein